MQTTHRRQGGRWFACVLGMVTVLGCDKKGGDAPTGTAASGAPMPTPASTAIAEDDPVVVKTRDLLKRIAGLRAASEATPPTRQERALEKPLAEGTFALLGQEQLDDPSKRPEFSVADGPLGDCATALAPGGMHLNLVYKDELDRCSTLQYIGVIRTARLVKPTIHEESKTFDPGVFDGDVLVINLASGTIEGAYPLHTESSSKLERSNDGLSWERTAFIDMAAWTKTQAEYRIQGKRWIAPDN